MAGNYKGNEVNSKDFLEILFALKNNIMKDLNVCEVAQIESISNDIYKYYQQMKLLQRFRYKICK